MASTDHTPRVRRALITGASSGLGAAFAERLAAEQYAPILVARRRDRLEALAERLRQRHGVSAEVLPADLADRGQLRQVEERVAAERDLAMLVNSAGFGTSEPFARLDPDRAEEMIRLHVVALVRLTRAALPGMLARGSGAIINVASTLAYQARPRAATYCATKAFVKTFTEALQQELRMTSVRVQALCPDATRTEFFDRAGVDTAGVDDSSWIAPEAVVDASLKGLRLGEVVCLPTLEDAADLARLADLQQELLESAPKDTLAARYR